MKRLTSILVAAALIIASCSQAGKERPRMGLAMRSFDDPASIAIRRSIETAALDKAELAIIDGQNQQSAQDMQVDSFFQRKVASIAIDPVDGKALGPIIGKAKARRTPIVFFDRMPSEAAMRSWDKLFFVGTRGTEAGAALGEILAAFWKANPAAYRNNDDRAQYIFLAEDPSSPDALLLEGSCARALGAAGVKTERLSDSGAVAAGTPPREAAAALIAKFGERIEAVVCADPESTLGAIDAFKAAGYFKGRRYMPIVGASSGELAPQAAEALSSGVLLGAAVGDASSQGKAVFDLAYALATGRNPARAGWRITDAKYVWLPYRKLEGVPPSAQRR
jgi:methyl-galactoside transport system substrate-binding protein